MSDGQSTPPPFRHEKLPALLFMMIFVCFLAHLWRLNSPLLEHHGQRQVETSAMARNFAENGMHFMLPQIDWGGGTPGYVESEFPIYSYLVAIAARLFGWQDYWGRILNALFYIPTAILLFLFARRLYDERTALAATAFYSILPLSFYFSRSVQPDAMAALGSLAGVYFFWVWTAEDRIWSLLWSAMGLAIAVLIKPTNLYLGLPLLYLCVRRFSFAFLKKPSLWVYTAAVIVPAVLWYTYAKTLWDSYGSSLFRIFIVAGLPSITDVLWLSLVKQLLLRLVFAFATPAGLIFLAAGVLLRRAARNHVLYWWAAGFGVSIVLAMRNHQGHDYYQLPIMFAIACWMAAGAVFLWDQRTVAGKIAMQLVVIVLALAVLGGSVYQIRQFYAITNDEWQRVEFGRRVEQFSMPGERIIVLGWRPWRDQTLFWFQHRTEYGEYLFWYPQDFYLSHRKGWSLDAWMATPQFVETLRRRGARYFVTFSPELLSQEPSKGLGLREALDARHTKLEEAPHWLIYRLDPPPASVSGNSELTNARASAASIPARRR